MYTNDFMYKCRECGKDVYRTVSYDFGNHHFCQDCSDDLKLPKLERIAEKKCKIDYCYDDLDLFMDQIEISKSYNDMQYQQLKMKRGI